MMPIKTLSRRYARFRPLATGALIAAFALPGLSVCSFAAEEGPPAPAKKVPVPRGIAKNPNQVKGDEITPAQKQAVDKGLAWLSKRLQEHGSLNSGVAGYSSHAGITALAGLAFMQAGNLPGRGKYGKEVQQCLDFVLNSCTESGLIASDMTQGPMYGHGFATLFLAEVYGMTGDESVKEKL